MRPFYFGAADRPLFGVYSAPAARVVPRGGVAVCYPFGQEYLRSHRALRELCHQLNEQGQHTLRFDYFGCGDSSGLAEESSIDQWLTDIGYGVEELREAAGLERVTLLGLRLGGLLAAVAGGRGLPLSRLVLWDPVLSGRAYLEEIAERHRSFMQGRPRPRDWAEQQPPDEVLGTPLSPVLRTGIEALDLFALKHPPAPKVLLLTTQSAAAPESVRQHLQSLGAAVDHRHVDSPPLWGAQDDVDRALVPKNVIHSIGSWLAEAGS